MSFALKVLQPAATSSYDELIAKLKLPDLREAASTADRHRARIDNAPLNPYRVCSDGERTEHLTRLAGMWFGQGKAIEEVTRLCLGWNSNNTPPLKDDKIVSTVENIARTHDRNHPAKVVTPLFDLESARASRFAGEPPKRQYLLDGFLPLGKVGMIVATGGTGKSMFALQLAMSVAAGKLFLGWAVASPGSVLVLAAEDEDDELHRRTYVIAGTLGVRPEEWPAIDSRLYVKSMVAENNLMTASVRGDETQATDYVDRLLLVARQIGDLKLIIIDPASRFRGGEENAAQDATRFVEQLERLAQETGATVVVLHHVHKGASGADEQTQNAARGSSAFSDGVRWQMNLRTPTTKEAKSLGIPKDMRKRHLIAVNTKNNYGPMAEAVVLMRTQGGVLAAARQVAKGPCVEQRLYEFVKAEAAKGRSYTANEIETKWAGVKGRLGVAMNKVRVHISHGVNEGYFKRDEKGRIVLGDKAPA